MRFSRSVGRLTLAVVLVCSLEQTAMEHALSAQGRPVTASPVAPSALDRDIRAFLCTELASHTAQVSSLAVLPARVHGALTTGEYTWGTYMRALAAGADMCQLREVAGREVSEIIARIGLHEARAGGEAFTQLYAAQAIRQFGATLDANAVWQRLTAAEREQWKPLLDPSRFYDPVARQLKGRPENYLGVAARITAISFELGLIDRSFVDSVLERAAIQFTSGAIYADDAPPTGRYDRYSNEYARYVWEAAARVRRTDVLDTLRPSLKTQMRLWWDLVSADGYGYQWGRSLGVVSYLDTLEIAAFLAEHAEFRPAPLADLVSAYQLAWQWLRRDYGEATHVLSVFAFGRGNYAYITREREWQQTVGFFGKLAAAHTQLMAALAREPLAAIPPAPRLAPVARFEFFLNKAKGDRSAGVWVVRNARLAFALPFTTGTMPGVADYLPSPHGLPGFAAPVEQVYPALTPFITLPDARVVLGGDGADRISPDPSGQGVAASWTRWAIVGGKPGEPLATGLTSDVTWRLGGDAANTLTRDEVIRADRVLRLPLVRLAIPSTADRHLVIQTAGARIDRLEGAEGVLEASVTSAGQEPRISTSAAGDGPLGKGARAAVPLHLVYEWTDVAVGPDRPLRLNLRLTVAPR